MPLNVLDAAALRQVVTVFRDALVVHREAVNNLWDSHRSALNDAFDAWENDTGTLEGVGVILAKLQYLTTARTQTGA